MLIIHTYTYISQSILMKVDDVINLAMYTAILRGNKKHCISNWLNMLRN